MKEIELTKGQVALVDDLDYIILSAWKWVASKNGNTFYALRHFMEGGKKHKIYMHRYLMGETDKKVFIDHRDRNGLNNQRDNLRVCTKAQNYANRNKAKNCSSKYVGVSWHKKSGKWAVMLCKDYKPIYIGLFTSEEAAAKAYNEAAIRIHGEFATTNIINENNEANIHA